MQEEAEKVPPADEVKATVPVGPMPLTATMHVTPWPAGWINGPQLRVVLVAEGAKVTEVAPVLGSLSESPG